jgi:class 3 adenylate cyclase/tetratricopeptide (TPR) repeat protein
LSLLDSFALSPSAFGRARITLTQLLCLFLAKSGKLGFSVCCLHLGKTQLRNFQAMRCPECGSENENAVTHCAKCGAALTADVTTQLASVQAAVQQLRRYLPAVVADSVLHDQARLRGERREATVLFADVVNFTQLSVSLDAEAVFDLINGLLSRLVECIHRYDGMVDKFVGDGLMAVFGAPNAHENDPELAVRAALDMQRATAEFEPLARAQVGAPLQIRIGINSGPTIAGVIGTEQQAAYTVIGETVNLAARLQAAARPGGILVSSRVYQQTRALFNFQTSGTTHIKGFDQPVLVFEVVNDRAEPLATRGIAGVTTALLGRDEEIARLRKTLAAFATDRRGRLVVIQGEAGLGKSRLVQEWLSASLPETMVVWRGRGLPYTEGVGYAPFRSLLLDARRTMGQAEDWDARITPALRPFLRQILGLPLSSEENVAFRNLEPERVKQLTVLAVREWMISQARQRPVVAVLDDFHWADDLSRDLLQSIVDLIDEVPLLLCVMTRPVPKRPLHLEIGPSTRLLDAPVRLDLDLKPLSATHSRALFGALVELNDLPEQIIGTILARAEGNPFYIEEFVRMLIEKDVLKPTSGKWRVGSAVEVRTIEVPTTLGGLMLTRCDRLPKELQQVMRDASVIGLEFPARLLEEVERRLHGLPTAAPMLDRLTELGMLEQRHGTVEPVFAFCHILTQETVYNSLLHSQRPALHRTVAESIEFLYSEDVMNQAEALAQHYDRARVRDRAMLYSVLAGNRAKARFANYEAIEHYSRALQLAQHLSGHESARWQAAMGLGDVEQLIGEYEEAAAFYQAMLEEWTGATAENRTWAMLKLGQVWDKRGDLHEADAWLQKALKQLDKVRGVVPELRGQVYSELGWLNLRRGDLSAAQQWLEQGLALVSKTQSYGVRSSILNRLGALHYNRGQWSEAVKCVEQALELRERLGDVVGYARSLNNLGILKWASGDWDGAQSDYQRAVEMHEGIGEAEGLVQAGTNLGLLYTDRGDWLKAEETLQRSLAIAQRIAHPYELAQSHMNLGRLYLFQERWVDSAKQLNAAVNLYEESGARENLNLKDTYYLLGVLALEQGQLDTAQQWAKRSYDLLREVTHTDQGKSPEWGNYYILIGRIAMARNDVSGASRQFDRGITTLQEGGLSIEAARAMYWRASLLLKQGRSEQARQDLEASRLILEQLRAAADLQRVNQLAGMIQA